MDRQYQLLPRPTGGIVHDYGPRVHILSEPYPMSLLARLGSPEVTQPVVGMLLTAIYDWLFAQVCSRLLVVRRAAVPTRMAMQHPEGVYEGEVVDATQKVVVVDIARGGIVPSQLFYDKLHTLVDPSGIRLDHVVASRVASETGGVIGVTLGHTKIGGPVDDALVILPDPMAATGTSLEGVLEHYRTNVAGTPRGMVAVHLIATPEYLKRMTVAWPDLEIVVVRLDRGLSAPDVLESRPGSRWSEERGLDAHDYIVPGAGGLGEVLNNAWI